MSDEFEGVVVVSTASVLRGYLRSRLADQGLREEVKPDDDPLLRIAKWTQYPALRAGSSGGSLKFFDVEEYDDEGNATKRTLSRRVKAEELSFDDYLEVPESFMIEWLDAVFEVNPHWLMALAERPDPESEEGKD